jgi:hypothetical protein
MCQIGLEFLDRVLIATTKNCPSAITPPDKSRRYAWPAGSDFLDPIVIPITQERVSA